MDEPALKEATARAVEPSPPHARRRPVRVVRRRSSQAEAAHKPLWGFGWAGWMLLTIAITLAASLVMGYDLRYQLQKLVMNTLGVDAMMRFTIELGNTAVCTGLWPPRELPGAITLCIVLLAVQLHPRGFGVLRLVPLWAVMLLGPIVWMRLLVMLNRSIRDSGGTDRALLLSAMIWWAVCFGVLWLALRSWRVMVPVGLALLTTAGSYALPWIAEQEVLPERVFEAFWNHSRKAGLVMNAALAAILIPWAIHARLHILPPHACQSCGYDLRGSPSAPCPECGTPPEQAVDSPSPAAPAATPDSSPRSPA